MITNIQHTRFDLEQSDEYKELTEQYCEHNIYVGNFGFIIVPHNNAAVLKIYTDKKYFEIEKISQGLFQSLGISVPDFLQKSYIDICGGEYICLYMENIRTYNNKIEDINDINIQQLARLISTIHSNTNQMGEFLIHGNLHHSNFYLDINNELGIFDFVSSCYAQREYDISILYKESHCSDSFLNSFFVFYTHSHSIDIQKVYKYTIIKIYENIKYANDITIGEKKGMIKQIQTLKNKIDG